MDNCTFTGDLAAHVGSIIETRVNTTIQSSTFVYGAWGVLINGLVDQPNPHLVISDTFFETQVGPLQLDFGLLLPHCDYPECSEGQ